MGAERASSLWEDPRESEAEDATACCSRRGGKRRAFVAGSRWEGRAIVRSSRRLRSTALNVERRMREVFGRKEAHFWKVV